MSFKYRIIVNRVWYLQSMNGRQHTDSSQSWAVSCCSKIIRILILELYIPTASKNTWSAAWSTSQRKRFGTEAGATYYQQALWWSRLDGLWCNALFTIQKVSPLPNSSLWREHLRLSISSRMGSGGTSRLVCSVRTGSLRKGDQWAKWERGEVTVTRKKMKSDRKFEAAAQVFGVHSRLSSQLSASQYLTRGSRSHVWFPWFHMHWWLPYAV